MASAELSAAELADVKEQQRRWFALLPDALGAHLRVFEPIAVKQAHPYRLSYKPLRTETSIRLVRIHPLPASPSSHDDLFQPIICSIKDVDLKDKPQYTALSYCWGDPQTIYAFRDLYHHPDGWNTACYGFHLENGQRVSVGANLYAALLSLRLLVTVEHFKTSPYPTGVACPCFDFWIDALSIDQQNLDERSSQVALMHDIYKEATLVNVWVGGSDPTSDIFMNVSRKLVLFFAQHPDQQHLQEYRIDDVKTYEKLGLSPMSVGEWLAVYAFFSRSWFTRTWVAQELAVAKKAFLLCGAQFYDLDELCSIQQGLRHSKWISQLERLASSYIDIGSDVYPLQHDDALPLQDIPRLFLPTNDPKSNMMGLIEIFQVAFGLGHRGENLWQKGVISYERNPNASGYTLAELVGTFRDLHATDPRDKIYGIMGLSNEVQNGTMALAEVPIRTDYKANVRETYTRATAHMLSVEKNLSTLEMKVSRKHNTHSLPSWVPDFSEYIVVTNGPWSAMNDFDSSFDVDLNQSSINTLGRKKSVVVAIFSSLTKRIDLASLAHFLSQFPGETSVTLPHWTPSRLDYFKRSRWLIANSSTEQTSTKQSRWEIFWRTQISNTDDPEYPAGREATNRLMNTLEATLLEGMATFIRWYQFIGMEMSITQSQESYIQMYTDQALKILNNIKAFQNIIGSSIWNDLHRFDYIHLFLICILELALGAPSVWTDATLSSWEYKRRSLLVANHWASMEWTLFRTSDGLLGKGPSTLKANDEIWLLPGLQCPVLLRPVPKSVFYESVVDEYQMVQTVYVHGIMHGEAAKGLKREQFRRICLV